MAHSRRTGLLPGIVNGTALFLTGCGGGDSGPAFPAKDFDYTPPTSAQLQDIQTLWSGSRCCGM